MFRRPRQRWKLVDYSAAMQSLLLVVPFVALILAGPAFHDLIDECGCHSHPHRSGLLDTQPNSPLAATAGDIRSDGGEDACLPIATVDTHRDVPADRGDQRPQDSDDCPICQLLAQSHQRTSIVRLSGLITPVVNQIPSDAITPDLSLRAEPLSRGPPA